MSRYQRAVVLMATLVAIVLIASVATTFALPVQGNLGITSGTILLRQGVIGPFLEGSVAGPGFSIGLQACAEQACARSVPGLTTSLPSVPIPPATAFPPLSFGSNLIDGNAVFDSVGATILGVTYRGSSNAQIGDNFFRVISPLRFAVHIETPAVLPPSPETVTLTSPFDFRSEWIITVPNNTIDPLLDLQLTGEGIATATLFGPVCFPGPCGWRLEGMTFDFGMTLTPDPATLLLWGTSAAGLGLARWLKRRRSRDHEYAA